MNTHATTSETAKAKANTPKTAEEKDTAFKKAQKEALSAAMMKGWDRSHVFYSQLKAARKEHKRLCKNGRFVPDRPDEFTIILRGVCCEGEATIHLIADTVTEDATAFNIYYHGLKVGWFRKETVLSIFRRV